MGLGVICSEKVGVYGWIKITKGKLVISKKYSIFRCTIILFCVSTMSQPIAKPIVHTTNPNGIQK
jgi:hypothetical protein